MQQTIYGGGRITLTLPELGPHPTHCNGVSCLLILQFFVGILVTLPRIHMYWPSGGSAHSPLLVACMTVRDELNVDTNMYMLKVGGQLWIMVVQSCKWESNHILDFTRCKHLVPDLVKLPEAREVDKMQHLWDPAAADTCWNYQRYARLL